MMGVFHGWVQPEHYICRGRPGQAWARASYLHRLVTSVFSVIGVGMSYRQGGLLGSEDLEKILLGCIVFVNQYTYNGVITNKYGMEAESFGGASLGTVAHGLY